MFFTVSKIAGFLLQPTIILTLATVICAIGLFTRFFKFAKYGIVLIAIALSLIAFSPLNFILMASLEYRIEKPTLPDHVDGMVILGGALDGLISFHKNHPELHASADRITEAAVLAKQFSSARIIISGSANVLDNNAPSEAIIARKLLAKLGIVEQRIEIEGKARNTHQNALYSKQLATPQSTETWLLVTSAYHMPRSYSIFRTNGWGSIIPWPVDYRTRGSEDVWRVSTSTRKHFSNIDIAIREYIGLLAYWLTGRTDQLLPSLQTDPQLINN